LYLLVPGIGAFFCAGLALTQVHGGSRTFAGIALYAGAGNVGAAIFILIVGAPGLFRTWKRWAWGLSGFVVVAIGAFAIFWSR
jgi:hypothetical protein